MGRSNQGNTLCYQINQYGVQHSYKIGIGVHDATYPGCS